MQTEFEHLYSTYVKFWLNFYFGSGGGGGGGGEMLIKDLTKWCHWSKICMWSIRCIQSCFPTFEICPWQTMSRLIDWEGGVKGWEMIPQSFYLLWYGKKIFKWGKACNKKFHLLLFASDAKGRACHFRFCTKKKLCKQSLKWEVFLRGGLFGLRKYIFISPS